VRKVERSTARKINSKMVMKREKNRPMSGITQKIAANRTILQGAIAMRPPGGPDGVP
jgi:hypothetical protein